SAGFGSSPFPRWRVTSAPWSSRRIPGRRLLFGDGEGLSLRARRDQRRREEPPTSPTARTRTPERCCSTTDSTRKQLPNSSGELHNANHRDRKPERENYLAKTSHH